MKTKFRDLAVGQCYRAGTGKLRKKVATDRYVSVNKKGKARTRKQRGNPPVTASNCDLALLGEGRRIWPAAVVEMGRKCQK